MKTLERVADYINAMFDEYGVMIYGVTFVLSVIFEIITRL